MKYYQDKWNNLHKFKLAASSIRKKLDSTDDEDVQKAMEEYVYLVESFYQFNEHIKTSQQYKAAKEDFEFFMRLLEITIQYASLPNPI